MGRLRKGNNQFLSPVLTGENPYFSVKKTKDPRGLIEVSQKKK